MHIKDPASNYQRNEVKGPAGGSETLHKLFFLCCHICDSGRAKCCTQSTKFRRIPLQTAGTLYTCRKTQAWLAITRDFPQKKAF